MNLFPDGGFRPPPSALSEADPARSRHADAGRAHAGALTQRRGGAALKAGNDTDIARTSLTKISAMHRLIRL